MTKSRQSVTKLRLSRIIRCLLALGCIKLAIMGIAVLDLPMPAWWGSATKTEQPAAQVAETGDIISEPVREVVEVPKLSAPEPEELPQGSAAAELAAAAKPRRQGSQSSALLPAPLLPATQNLSIISDGSQYSTPLLPEPDALGAPLVRAGVIMPDSVAQKSEPKEDNIWDVLDLKSLPIPGLGGVQVAHAASLDMPVPQTPKAVSPFAPGEQTNPLANQPRVMPGAPPFPTNIPNIQPDGTPLAPIQPTLGQSGGYAPAPQSNPLQAAPAPNIIERQSNFTPNAKAQELAKQQQDILMLRQQMDQRLKDLQIAEEKMKGMLRDAQNTEDQKVKSLVQMYANMKPRTAAQALENMDERVAVKILSGMAPKQSGEILTYTNPVKTAKFTEMLTRLRLGN